MLNGYSLMRGVLFSIGYFHVITSVYEISGTTWLGFLMVDRPRGLLGCMAV